jgi:hypothetical protein
MKNPNFLVMKMIKNLVILKKIYNDTLIKFKQIKDHNLVLIYLINLNILLYLANYFTPWNVLFDNQYKLIYLFVFY